MDVDGARALPDPQICEQARLSRDPRFDGLFFTAVTSTGIYCRPICPAPTPRTRHVRYYPSAAAAEAAGFRPCLRCRPELAPADGWLSGDATVARALKLIDDGLLAEQPVAALAERVGLGERQLRRLFVERLGAPPHSVHGTRRLLFAKQLLTETALPITEVALEAGFGSLRRFNSSFRDAYGMAPRDLRRRPRHGNTDSGTENGAGNGSETLTLRLGYRPPYDLPALLAFLRTRALPGVEAVDAHGYARTFGPAGAPGWLRLSAWPGVAHTLRLELHCPRPVRTLEVVTRLRRMFDLSADPRTIAAVLSEDEQLRPLVARHPGLRLPGGWDGFEIAVRAVLGQQVSVAAARTLAGRLVERFGDGLETPFALGLERLFPTPEALADADISTIGLPRTRAATLRGVARALLDGRVDFRPERPLEDFTARWQALSGIGPWTAHYIAMRALGAPDAFPADDLVLRRVAERLREAPRSNASRSDAKRQTGCDRPLTAKALTARAERWRPWRAYAVIQLWQSSSSDP